MDPGKAYSSAFSNYLRDTHPTFAFNAESRFDPNFEMKGERLSKHNKYMNR